MQIEDSGLDEWARREWRRRHGIEDDAPFGCGVGLMISLVLWTVLVLSCWWITQ
jgi:hypothetical protein